MHRHPGGETATRKLISLAALAPGARVIDLGAGDGDAVRLLRSLGYEAVGVDITPGEDVQYGDLFAPPYAPGSFDAALSQCVFCSPAKCRARCPRRTGCWPPAGD